MRVGVFSARRGGQVGASGSGLGPVGGRVVTAHAGRRSAGDGCGRHVEGEGEDKVRPRVRVMAWVRSALCTALPPELGGSNSARRGRLAAKNKPGAVKARATRCYRMEREDVWSQVV